MTDDIIDDYHNARGEKPPNPEHVRKAKMHEASKHHPDRDAVPFRIGDPVMDAAQGRPMVVLERPDQTVAEWSDANGYDLTENYGNQKFGVGENEPVYTCRYVSDVSGDPGKTYTFPQSRLRLIDVHHADDGRRVYDRVAVDVLEALITTAYRLTDEGYGDPPDGVDVADLAKEAGVDEDVVGVAFELADATVRL